MTLQKIAMLVNQALAGEMLMYDDMVYYLDKAVDAINNEMNTIFPVFSDLTSDVIEYTAIPDRYIRQIIVPAAAWRYFNADEEGNSGSPQYEIDMREGLFYMKRDYSSQIPVEFQAPDSQGSIRFEIENDETGTGERGIVVDGNIWQL